MLKNIIILILTTSLLSSCAGVITVGGIDKKYRNLLDINDQINKKSTATSKAAPLIWNKATIKSLYGEPESIERNLTYDSWFYERDWTGKGLIVFLVALPVPLMIPYKHYQSEFRFENDKLVEVVTYRNGPKLALACGLMAPVDGCFAGYLQEDGEVDGTTLFKWE